MQGPREPRAPVAPGVRPTVRANGGRVAKSVPHEPLAANPRENWNMRLGREALEVIRCALIKYDNVTEKSEREERITRELLQRFHDEIVARALASERRKAQRKNPPPASQ